MPELIPSVQKNGIWKCYLSNALRGSRSVCEGTLHQHGGQQTLKQNLNHH